MMAHCQRVELHRVFPEKIQAAHDKVERRFPPFVHPVTIMQIAGPSMLSPTRNLRSVRNAPCDRHHGVVSGACNEGCETHVRHLAADLSRTSRGSHGLYAIFAGQVFFNTVCAAIRVPR